MNELAVGVVEKGLGIAANLGYRTANIKYTGLLRNGVYGVRVTIAELDLRDRPGLCFLQNGKLEVHILNFEGDLYGFTMEVSFRKFIREPRKFESEQLLRKQINLDYHQVLKDSNGPCNG